MLRFWSEFVVPVGVVFALCCDNSCSRFSFYINFGLGLPVLILILWFIVIIFFVFIFIRIIRWRICRWLIILIIVLFIFIFRRRRRGWCSRCTTRASTAVTIAIGACLICYSFGISSTAISASLICCSSSSTWVSSSSTITTTFLLSFFRIILRRWSCWSIINWRSCWNTILIIWFIWRRILRSWGDRRCCTIIRTTILILLWCCRLSRIIGTSTSILLLVLVLRSWIRRCATILYHGRCRLFIIIIVTSSSDFVVTLAVGGIFLLCLLVLRCGLISTCCAILILFFIFSRLITFLCSLSSNRVIIILRCIWSNWSNLLWLLLLIIIHKPIIYLNICICKTRRFQSDVNLWWIVYVQFLMARLFMSKLKAFVSTIQRVTHFAHSNVNVTKIMF